MACLLVLVVVATVLMGTPGKLTHAARTSPAEAFWRAALPGAPMPEAIRELLRPGADAGTDDGGPKHHDADPPPLSFSYDADPPPLTFNYGDYKSTPRNEGAAPSAEVLDRVAGGARNSAASLPTVLFPGGAPMPEAIRELLRHGANARSDDVRPMHRDHDDDPPPLPPMNFKYDEYKSTPPRNKAAAPSAQILHRVAAGARNAAVSPPTVFFLEEAVRVGGILPFPSIFPRDTANAVSPPPLRLYTVRAVRAVDGSRFVVCRRVAGPSPGPGLGDDERDAVYWCRATGPARAYMVGVVGERGETTTAAVVCRTTDVSSRWNRARAAAAFWLLDVKPGAPAAAVCHAALDAQVIPVKSDRSSTTALV